MVDVPVGTAAPTAQGAGFQNNLTNAHNTNAQAGAPLMEAYIDRFGRTAFRFVDATSGQPFDQPQVIQPVGDVTGVPSDDSTTGVADTGDTGTGDAGFGTGSGGLIDDGGDRTSDFGDGGADFDRGITNELDQAGFTVRAPGALDEFTTNVFKGVSAVTPFGSVLGPAVTNLLESQPSIQRTPGSPFTLRDAIEEVNDPISSSFDPTGEGILTNVEDVFTSELNKIAQDIVVATAPSLGDDFTQDDFDSVSEVASGLGAISDPLGDDFADETDNLSRTTQTVLARAAAGETISQAEVQAALDEANAEAARIQAETDALNARIIADNEDDRDSTTVGAGDVDADTASFGGFGGDQQQADNPDDRDGGGSSSSGGPSSGDTEGSSFHQGGFVHKHQAKSAKLQGGEFIMNKAAVRQKGTDFFDKLNNPEGFAGKKK